MLYVDEFSIRHKCIMSIAEGCRSSGDNHRAVIWAKGWFEKFSNYQFTYEAAYLASVTGGGVTSLIVFQLSPEEALVFHGAVSRLRSLAHGLRQAIHFIQA